MTIVWMCCVPLGKQTEKTHYSILIMYLKKFTITLKFTILKLFLAVKNDNCHTYGPPATLTTLQIHNCQKQWNANSLFSEIQSSVARKEKVVSLQEYKTGRKENSSDPEIGVMQALKKCSMSSIITTKCSDRCSINKANSVLNSELKRE